MNHVTILRDQAFAFIVDVDTQALEAEQAGFGIQWTPTYIKSDAAGWWCGYYGCYVVSDAQYSNQWDLSAGIKVRLQHEARPAARAPRTHMERRQLFTHRPLHVTR